MKYVSLDIETTGLDPVNHDVLSIGAVIDDLQKPEVPVEDLPKIHILIHYKELTGSSVALAMNADLIKRVDRLSERRRDNSVHKYLEPDEKFVTSPLSAGSELRLWLSVNFRKLNEMFPAPIPVIGKNVRTFDIPFLINNCDVGLFTWHRRIMDPTALWIEPTDEEPPSLLECMKRAGVTSGVMHDAIEDAWNTIRVFRKGLTRIGR